MDDRFVFSLGLAAGFFTTISFVPQVWHIWKRKTTGDLSWLMYGMFTFGSALWLTYGIYSHSVPVTLANAITLVLNIFVLILKWRYDCPEKGVAQP